jgi:hypothetical protein
MISGQIKVLSAIDVSTIHASNNRGNQLIYSSESSIAHVAYTACKIFFLLLRSLLFSLI